MEDDEGNRWTIDFNAGTSSNVYSNGGWANQYSADGTDWGEDSLGYVWTTDEAGNGYLKDSLGQNVVHWVSDSRGNIDTIKSNGEQAYEKKHNNKNIGWIKSGDGWKYNWDCDKNGLCSAYDSQGNYWFQDDDYSEYVYYFDGSVYFYDAVNYIINYFDNIFWYQYNFHTWEFKRHHGASGNYIPFSARNI
mmetsp:Transcript_44733/g.43327  ORF Transcript_44733/g.43327 Transcript_44733/m.43327 type:complete len:191 (+) Transcript_44733:353-925(+)